MRPPLGFFVDHALAARLEAVDASQLEAIARAVGERLPQSGATSIRVGGGVASFVFPHLSFSRAAGVGMNGPVSVAEVETLEAFFRERHTEARIRLSPFAHPSLYSALAERGFSLVYLDSFLVRLLAPGETFAPPADGVTVRRAEPGDEAVWVATSLRGFDQVAPPEAARLRIHEAAFFTRGATYFLALVGNEVAGTAAVYIDGQTARIHATSTVPEHRGRGVQGALVRARLAHAVAAGCTHVSVATEPGNASQRNMERHGFLPISSQALLMKSFADYG